MMMRPNTGERGRAGGREMHAGRTEHRWGPRIPTVYLFQRWAIYSTGVSREPIALEILLPLTLKNSGTNTTEVSSTAAQRVSALSECFIRPSA